MSSHAESPLLGSSVSQSTSYLIKRELGLVVSAMFFLFFSLVMLAHFSDHPALSAMRVVNPLAGVIPFMASMCIPFLLYRNASWVNVIFGLLVAVLTLFGNVGVYQNGVMTYALGSSFLLLLTMLAAPQRWIFLIGFIAALVPVLAIMLSPVDSEFAITSRVFITLLTLLWPITTLIHEKAPLSELKWIAFKQLVMGGIICWTGWSLIGVSDFTTTWPQLTVALLALYFVSLVKQSNVFLSLLLSAVALGMYLFAIEHNGQIAVFSLPIYLLALFLLLAPSLAVFISALLILNSALSINLLEAEFARSLISSIVFLAMLSIWFVALTKADITSYQPVKGQFNDRFRTIGFSFLVSCTVLVVVNLPFFFAGFALSFNETGVRWAVLELVILTILTWGFWVYLEQRKLHEDELIKARKEAEINARSLQERQDKQSQIFSIIGHELRTPLASMNMMFNAMDMRSYPPYGAAIVDTGQSVLSILDDLRVVMQPERINEKSNERAAPASIIERTLLSLSGLLKQQGMTLHFEVDDDSNRQAMFNTSSLRQVVTNITKNAALHSEGQDVWVSCKADIVSNEMRLRIRIEDNGKGIPKDKQNEMFQAFTRGDSQSEGTGLGLFIIGELLQLLKGTVTYFESDKGGAGFDILCRLSLEAGAHKTPTVDVENAKMINNVLQGKRVLFAEDTPTLQMLTKSLLEKAGAEVVACNHGKDALEAYQTGEFDLCLTDIMMPLLDGYQLAAELRLKGFKGPIIGLTAAVIGDESDRLQDAGANVVLSKPVDIEKLKQSIFHLC